MKIKDLITLRVLSETGIKYANQTQKKYYGKNGYCWTIPSHSVNQGVLLNAYERDCVVAYIENKYFIAFLIRTKAGRDRFKGFCYLKDEFCNIAPFVIKRKTQKKSH